jgi:transcription elongation factor Elf1
VGVTLTDNERRKAMERENAGIDYSNGMSNVNHETGIHYGVINQNKVFQSWADSNEANYGDPEEAECPECETDFTIPKDTKWGDEIECVKCGEKFTIEIPDCAEPLSFYIDDGEYLAECEDDGDIFITKSPYYTLCQYCSPCAPGAGYLMSPNKNGIKAYCFGHDFFEPKQQGEKPCTYCEGKQNMKRTKVDANGSTFVTCWVCYGKGTVPNMISKAPYPVYSVETGKLVNP